MPESQVEDMNGRDSAAVAIALAHIQAWSNHDWDTTRALLSPDVHALVTTISPQWRSVELRGIENYMGPKMKGAQLVEPGSVHVRSAVGDERRALILATMRIALGPGGTMVTMARALLYFLDENRHIKEEVDQFVVLSD